MQRAREVLLKYKDCVVGVQPPSMFSGNTDRDLMYSIQGPDLARLEKYSNQLMARLKQMPGVADLEITYESGKPEVRVNINRDKAADLNVNVASVANAMRVLVGGDDQVSTYKEGDDRYDVLLRVKKEFRNSAQALERLYVPSSSLGNVAISSVATLDPGTGPTSIDRWNRQRRILIMANLSHGLALSDLMKTVDAEMTAMNLPPDYHHAAVGRSRELARTIGNFLIAFMLLDRVHVHDSGGQLRELHRPGDDPAQPAAVGTVCVAEPVPDPAELLGHLLVARHPGAVRDCEEELDSADRPHQGSATRGHAATCKPSSRAAKTGCARF